MFKLHNFLLPMVLGAAPLLGQAKTYHGVSASLHASLASSYTNQNYEILSLSVAGSLGSERYSAVWVRKGRLAPVSTHAHGLDKAAFTTWQAVSRTFGFRTKLITASGVGQGEVFAGVMVKDGKKADVQFDVTRSTLEARCAWARDNGYKLQWASSFGSALSPRYVAVFEENPEKIAWGYGLRDSSADLSQRFAAMTEASAYPRHISPDAWGNYLSIWHDDRLGGFATYWGLSATQLANQISTRSGSGQYPIFLAGGGLGTTRWAVTFARRHLPLPRNLTLVPAAAQDPAMDPFDKLGKALVTNTGARSAAVAIAKDGRLVFARAYTNAESDYPVATPTSMFRIGSCTKPICALMAHELAELGGITMSTKLGPYLNLSPTDPRFNSISVADTIQHVSGIRSNTDAWAVAQWANPIVPTLPVSSAITTLYHSKQWLVNTPGTVDEYSNEGYLVLGDAIAKSSGKPWEDFLRENVAAPLGITRIWIGGNGKADRKAGEVLYHHSNLWLGPSQRHTDRRPLSAQYGRDFDLNRTYAPGALVTSVVDMVKLLSGSYGCEGRLLTAASKAKALARPSAPRTVDRGGFAWKQRPNGVISHGKGGSIAGGRTEIVWRSDNVAIAVCVNRSGVGISRNAFENVADQLTAQNAWPTGDQFGRYKLPTVQSCPRILNSSPTTLPNVTEAFFSVRGSNLSNVSHLSFGGLRLDPRGTRQWRNGCFELVDDKLIKVYPPQGMAPGLHALIAHSSRSQSTPIRLTITLPSTHRLVAPAKASLAYTAFLSLGQASPRSFAYLALSRTKAPSSIPFLVDLGIGANFTDFYLLPPFPFGGAGKVCQWKMPGLPLSYYMQAAVVDPNSRSGKLAVSNIEQLR